MLYTYICIKTNTFMCGRWKQLISVLDPFLFYLIFYFLNIFVPFMFVLIFFGRVAMCDFYFLYFENFCQKKKISRTLFFAIFIRIFSFGKLWRNSQCSETVKNTISSLLKCDFFDFLAILKCTKKYTYILQYFWTKTYVLFGIYVYVHIFTYAHIFDT